MGSQNPLSTCSPIRWAFPAATHLHVPDRRRAASRLPFPSSQRRENHGPGPLASRADQTFALGRDRPGDAHRRRIDAERSGPLARCRSPLAQPIGAASAGRPPVSAGAPVAGAAVKPRACAPAPRVVIPSILVATPLVDVALCPDDRTPGRDGIGPSAGAGGRRQRSGYRPAGRARARPGRGRSGLPVDRDHQARTETQ